MSNRISRRSFLATSAGAAVCASMPAAANAAQPAPAPEFPLVDFHAHISSQIPIEKALEISARRGVKFGIVEHAGKKEYKYPGLLSTDADLLNYIAALKGKPVFKGVQAEGVDWMECFSKQAVAQLDYVLTDALTFPEKDGALVRLWTPEFHLGEKQDFMERYTAYNVRVIAKQPVDIMANPTFLPSVLEAEYDTLWTEDRMKKIINAAVEYNVAIEINSRYRLPSLAFLKLAKKAGARFSFGSNIHDENVGKLDYCVEMAAELGLKSKDMFMPAPAGRKPIEIRKF